MEEPETYLVALEALKKHATSLDLTAEIITEERYNTEEDDSHVLRIELSNGREKHPLFIRNDSVARELLNVPLDKIVFLGDYSAYLNRESEAIEAQIVGLGSALVGRAHFRRIPGMGDSDELSTEEESRLIPTLSLNDGNKQIMLGEVSDIGKLMLGERFSSRAAIRLDGFGQLRHDDALDVLEEFSGSLFFDFDVMYSVSLSLRRRPRRMARALQKPSTKEPVFPKSKYSTQALSLYQYGRSARGLPLLEFLAYYQAIEFFFPAFAQEEASSALRTELLNPRFNPSSDNDISRLIRLAAPAVRAGIGEKEQLRATLRSVTTLEGLREAIDRLETKEGNSLTDRTKKLKGVAALQVERDDLREQLADRIYTIRCRIVHAKQDGVLAAMKNCP